MLWDGLGPLKRSRVSCCPSGTHLEARETHCDLRGKEESITPEEGRGNQGPRENSQYSQGYTAWWQDQQAEPCPCSALYPKATSCLTVS